MLGALWQAEISMNMALTNMCIDKCVHQRMWALTSVASTNVVLVHVGVMGRHWWVWASTSVSKRLVHLCSLMTWQQWRCWCGLGEWWVVAHVVWMCHRVATTWEACGQGGQLEGKRLTNHHEWGVTQHTTHSATIPRGLHGQPCGFPAVRWVLHILAEFATSSQGSPHPCAVLMLLVGLPGQRWGCVILMMFRHALSLPHNCRVCQAIVLICWVGLWEGWGRVEGGSLETQNKSHVLQLILQLHLVVPSARPPFVLQTSAAI